MDKKNISLVCGAAVLALTGTASAGPMSVASPQIVTPPLPIEQVYYRYHHRHYGWYRHRHYYRYYGWNPGAAVAGTALGLAAAGAAAATGWPYYGYYGHPYYGYPYHW